MADKRESWHWRTVDKDQATAERLVNEHGNAVLMPNRDGRIEVENTDAMASIELVPKMKALLRHIALEVLPHEYGHPDLAPDGIAEAAAAILDEITERSR